MKTTKKIMKGRFFVAVAACAMSACAPPTRAGGGDQDVGLVRLDLTNAPTNARCAVITVTPQTGAAVVDQFPLVPQQPATFDLSGLPLGMVTLTEQVFTVACPVPATQAPTWSGDPVTVTLTAGQPVDVSFALAEVDKGGQADIQTSFPQPNTITEFSVGGFITEITTGPDNNLWVIDVGSNAIIRVTPGGFPTSFPIPTANAGLAGITAGPDGNLWFTEATKIGRITPSGAITEFQIPTPNANAAGIAPGRDGNLWFVELSTNNVGRITPAGIITEFGVPTPNSELSEIAAGPDGNLWFTEFQANKIGRITLSGTVAEFAIPTSNALPGGITAGPDGNIWFTEEIGERIGRITPGGSIVEFSVGSGTPVPSFITTGSDGNLWFTEQDTGTLARITPIGVVTVFPVQQDPVFVFGITNGPDGNIWFTNGPNVGRLHP